MKNESERRLLPRGLYALCDDGVRAELPLPEKAARLVEGGVRVLQLRMKRTFGQAAVEAARAVGEICTRAGALWLINDRVDLALLLDAPGVHLGEEDLPVEAARALLGPGKIIGVTSRDLAAVGRAWRGSADYVGVGPVFASRSKPLPVPPLGVDGLRQVVAGSPVPVVAISGIDLTNIRAVGQTGAHAAAVAGALLLSADIAESARVLARAFG